MHPKVQALLNESLEQILNILKEYYPADYKIKYQDIIKEIVKIRHDDSASNGFKYFPQLIDSLDKVAGFPSDNFKWYDSIGRIAFLMNETDPVYKADATEAANQAEEVYNHLIGIVSTD